MASIQMTVSDDDTVRTRRRRSTKPVEDMTLLEAWFYYFDLDNHKTARQVYPIMTVLLPLAWIITFAVTADYYDVDPFNESFSNVDRRKMESLQYPERVKDDAHVWQLITFAFLHASLPHLLANVFSFVFFSYYVETRYRWYRVLVIWTVCSISSGIFYCTVLKAEDVSGNLVGSSGGVYGIMGAFISEALLNLETIRWKKTKALITVLLLCAHVYEYVEDIGGYGVYAHLGGLVCGLGPIMLYLPNYYVETWEPYLLGFCALLVVVIFVALPVYIFT